MKSYSDEKFKAIESTAHASPTFQIFLKKLREISQKI